MDNLFVFLLIISAVTLVIWLNKKSKTSQPDSSTENEADTIEIGQCNHPEFEYDNYYDEYVCKKCGLIVKEEPKKILSGTSFKEKVLESNLPSVVHFSLESEYDTQMESLLDDLIESLSGKVTFVKLNISENTDLCNTYGVSLAPTLLFFSDGKAVGYTIGVQTAESLRTQLSSMLDKPSYEHKEK